MARVFLIIFGEDFEMSNFHDRLRGMFLLGAYGDALGAEHEKSPDIAQAPFPKPLQPRRMLEQGFHWGTWLPNTVVASEIGVPTDDTCYRLFILHPWLQEIVKGNRRFTEESFREFMLELKERSAQPSWIKLPRDNQINAWLFEFNAQKETNSCGGFFSHDSPVIFGLFMYLETGAIIRGMASKSIYSLFKGFSRLDQRYATSATAFMTTLLSKAIEYNSIGKSFDKWFFDQSFNLIVELQETFPNDVDLEIIKSLFLLMKKLGSEYRGLPEEVFVKAFKEQVIEPDNPPFMRESFSKWFGGNFDPFRFLAQIVATVEFSAGDPALALRSIAYSFGDTDTIATFLGSLMGVWYGEQQLRNLDTPGLVFNDELTIVENVLEKIFSIDLDERARLFESLRFLDIANLMLHNTVL